MDTKTGLSGHDHHHRAENSHATHGMHHDHEAANTTTCLLYTSDAADE